MKVYFLNSRETKRLKILLWIGKCSYFIWGSASRKAVSCCERRQGEGKPHPAASGAPALWPYLAVLATHQTLAACRICKRGSQQQYVQCQRAICILQSSSHVSQMLCKQIKPLFVERARRVLAAGRTAQSCQQCRALFRNVPVTSYSNVRVILD